MLRNVTLSWLKEGRLDDASKCLDQSILLDINLTVDLC